MAENTDLDVVVVAAIQAHLRGRRAIAVGLAVNYLYGLLGKQSVPDLEHVSHLLLGYWPWAGGVLMLFAVISVLPERAHRRHEVPHFIGEVCNRMTRNGMQAVFVMITKIEPQ